MNKVEVEGNRLLGPDRVRTVADVPMGEQLALVDLEAISRRVAALAEVADVDVTRTWPDGIRIDVVERTAIAVVELGGRLRGLDADGVVFRDYRAAPKGMPRVRPAPRPGTDALAEAATVVAALPRDLAARVDHVEVADRRPDHPGPARRPRGAVGERGAVRAQGPGADRAARRAAGAGLRRQRPGEPDSALPR